MRGAKVLIFWRYVPCWLTQSSWIASATYRSVFMPHASQQLVAIYFWRQNIEGIPESSEKALRIMYVATTMVVIMIVWCGYTLAGRGAHLPPWPRLSNLVYSNDALGWLRHTSLPYTVGLIGILIGLGHSVLAMMARRRWRRFTGRLNILNCSNLGKGGIRQISLQPNFHCGSGFLRGDDPIPTRYTTISSITPSAVSRCTSLALCHSGSCDGVDTPQPRRRSAARPHVRFLTRAGSGEYELEPGESSEFPSSCSRWAAGPTNLVPRRGSSIQSRGCCWPIVGSTEPSS